MRHALIADVAAARPRIARVLSELDLHFVDGADGAVAIVQHAASAICWRLERVVMISAADAAFGSSTDHRMRAGRTPDLVASDSSSSNVAMHSSATSGLRSTRNHEPEVRAPRSSSRGATKTTGGCCSKTHA